MTLSRRPLIIRGACFIAIAISAYYLTWRLLDTFNPHAIALSIALYAAEAYGLFTFLLHTALSWDTRTLERRLGLRGDQSIADAALPAPAPRTVDVLIPTYNESVGLLRKTVLAAREIRLPHDTWVLDDGRRREVQEMCQELGVGYLTRSSNDHAKAGNLNAALARTKGELVVVLDADFIALPELLERTLPHFDADERLAFVQLPQAFYNVDSVQHLAAGDVRSGWHEQSLFYDVIQPGKNRYNSAFWCGSPAVLRRAALDSVGGAATSTITEDILTSMRMHAAGWTSLYHNEILAVGVAPGDLDGFRTQRLRWAQGSMQILRSRENPLVKRGLSLAQRASYFTSMTTYFQALQMALFVAMPALILATGQAPIRSFGLGFFARFVPYIVSVAVATKLSGRGRARLGWDLYFAGLRMFTFLRALPTLLTGGRGLRFRVTSKAPTTSARRRGLYPHAGAAALNLAVIALVLAAPMRDRFDSATTTVICASAALAAALYLVALVRLWRRVYRRGDYRVAAVLPASVALEDDVACLGRTRDVSFGGASLVLPRAIEPGTRVTVRLLDAEPLTVQGTIKTCVSAEEGSHRLGVTFDAFAPDSEHHLLALILEAAIGDTPRPQRHPRRDRDVLAPASRGLEQTGRLATADA